MSIWYNNSKNEIKLALFFGNFYLLSNDTYRFGGKLLTSNDIIKLGYEKIGDLD
jgi:hypothetical protein